MASEQEWSEALLNARVRIEEIERALERPPVTGEFPHWRKRFIREKLLLQQKIGDIERMLSQQPEKHSRRPVRRPARMEEQREAVITKVKNPSKYTVLTVPETAVFFEVTSRTIYRWLADAKLADGAKRGTITIASVRKLQQSRSKRRSINL